VSLSNWLGGRLGIQMDDAILHLLLHQADVPEKSLDAPVLFEEALASLVNFLNDRIVEHCSPSHQFRRSTHEWRLITCAPTNSIDSGQNESIRDVPAIPCEEIVHSVHRGNRNMQGVQLSL